MPSTYCFDTCIIIDLFSRYPAAPFVGLHTNVKSEISSLEVVSIEAVHDELRQGKKHTDSELQSMLGADPQHFFGPFDQAAVDELPKITRTASAYRPKGRNRKNADPYLVAYCRAHQLTLVTNDGSLVTAAKADGVRVLGFVDYLQVMGWMFP